METSLPGPGKFWIFLGRVHALRERRHAGREGRIAKAEAQLGQALFCQGRSLFLRRLWAPEPVTVHSLLS